MIFHLKASWVFQEEQGGPLGGGALGGKTQRE